MSIDWKFAHDVWLKIHHPVRFVTKVKVIRLPRLYTGDFDNNYISSMYQRVPVGHISTIDFIVTAQHIIKIGTLPYVRISDYTGTSYFPGHCLEVVKEEI